MFKTQRQNLRSNLHALREEAKVATGFRAVVVADAIRLGEAELARLEREADEAAERIADAMIRLHSAFPLEV